jgi:hypothetical protein
LLVSPTSAAEIGECDYQTHLINIVEPVKNSTRSFANGKIRVWHVDAGGEPVCCSSYLAIIFPGPRDEPPGIQCKLLGNLDGLGFVDVSVKRIKSSYRADKGLLLSVPVGYYDPDTGRTGRKERINVRINQLHGSVSIE